MSYCRWSDDDFQCDAYVWEDVTGGWRTEIAGRRPNVSRDVLPPVPEWTEGTHEAYVLAWLERKKAVMAQMRALEDTPDGYTTLPEPEGGGSYWHATPGECATNLERLRALGFNIPQHAIDELHDEHTQHSHP